MKDYKLVKQSGAWYILIDQKGKEIKFQSKDWEHKLEDKKLKKYVYNLICDKVILKYQSYKLGIDDVIETDDVVDEL